MSDETMSILCLEAGRAARACADSHAHTLKSQMCSMHIHTHGHARARTYTHVRARTPASACPCAHRHRRTRMVTHNAHSRTCTHAHNAHSRTCTHAHTHVRRPTVCMGSCAAARWRRMEEGQFPVTEDSLKAQAPSGGLLAPARSEAEDAAIARLAAGGGSGAAQ